MPGLSYDTVLHFNDVCLWIEIYYDFATYEDTCPPLATVTCVEVTNITADTFDVPRRDIPYNLLRAFDNIAFNMVINDEKIIGSLCGHGE